MKRALSLAAAGLLALSLAACSDDDGTVEKGGAAKPAAESSAPAKEAEAKAPTFGDAYEFKSGLKAAVSEPEEFTPGEYAMIDDPDAGTALAFTLTFTNGTDEPYDPSMFDVTVSSAGAEAEKVYDSDSIGDEPTTSVQPGKSVSFKVGFIIKDPNDITMDLSPDITSFDEDGITFIK
ncbi:MAG: hypothetical protein ACTIJJ_07235 [Galactobacter sp.]